MIWLYTAYFLVLIIEAWLAMRGDLANMADEPGLRGLLGRKLSFSPGPLSTTQCEEARQWLRVLGAFGVPLAIAFHGGVGALFGTISAHPYWHTPLVPVLFLTGALVSGGALMMFVIAAVWPERDSEYSETLAFLGKVVLGLLVFDLILEWAEFSIPMWYGVGHEYELMKRILFGDFWWVFWVVHILLGSAVPVYLLLSKKGPWATALAGLLIAAGFKAVRLNIVIPGQEEPNLRNLEQAFVDRRLTFAYVPSLFEWQVTMFVIAIGIALFYLGYKYLPLTAERRAS
jgi:molybdopterin-containing oxidoreductase family membrane subunit